MKKLLCPSVFVLTFLLLASFAAAQDLDSLFLQGKAAEDPGAVVANGPDLNAPLPAEPAGRIGLAQWKNGVVVGNLGSVAVILPNGNLAPSQLVHQLGSEGGGLFDTVVTLDGQTALVSNFGDSAVYFVDISNPYKLTVKGFVQLPFFAEDIALSPDSRWALVTDGGFSPRIAVIDVANMHLHNDFDTDNHYCNAVAISNDGRTVIGANYFESRLEVFSFDPATGSLHYKQSMSTLSKGYRPVNVSISPGCTTVVAVGPTNVSDPDEPGWTGPAGSVFQLKGGMLLAQRPVNGGSTFKGGQTAVFSNDGKFVYILGNVRSTTNDQFARGAVVKFPVINRGVLGAKSAMNSFDTCLGTSELFGVDALAIDNIGRYLYATNKTVSGSTQYIAILDANTLQLVYFKDAFPDYVDPSPVPYLFDIPTGVAFPTMLTPWASY